MSSPSQLRGYAALIAHTLGIEDPATLAVVEDFMRQQTGGVLDHLSPAAFAQHAREAYADARAWSDVGAINGCTLEDYCHTMGLALPAWTT